MLVNSVNSYMQNIYNLNILHISVLKSASLLVFAIAML